MIEPIKEQKECDECGNYIAEAWDFCPYCRIKDQQDELNMKKSLLTMEQKSLSKCPKCGMILDPTWIKCPKCFVETKSK
ncbi:MAG: hypothetical protein GF364_15425 [Candidatus Lokiarchaeota archaeon]|nr:hypothetical protein [Candidatus Lokiarchaeota archaeon]